jgi:hypothetical protein
MAEMENPTNESAAGTPASPAGGRTKDEVALELMRFITLQTGYGKSPQSSAGFSGKPGSHSAEEHAEALLELFLRCRQVVNQEE